MSRVLIRFAPVVLIACLSPCAWGQFPGAAAEEEGTAEATAAATQHLLAPAPPWSSPLTRIKFIWNKYLGAESPYRGLLLAVVTITILTVIYRQSTRWMQRFLKEQAYKEENARTFLRTWRTTWKFVISVFVILALSGSLRLLGLSAGFLGMMLGWSLQAPVTGIAAWLMIITKKPFQIGDRIILAGFTGDVTDITLTHVVLNQVGGSVGGEERSGRGVLIPNAILFSNSIINYTLEQKYMLDEVLVRLTFDSDFELAERLCFEAVHAVTETIIRDSGFEPNIRCEFYESGVLIRARYQTIPGDRQRISSDITRRILASFKQHYGQVRFCFPHSVVRYRPNEPEADLPPEAMRR